MILNIEKINIQKRTQIEAGMKFIEKINQDGVVRKVILFGSALTNDCDKDSDIDLCFVTDYDSKNPVFFQIYGELPLVMNDLCDILIYSKVNGKIKEEIDNKGVLIYYYEKE